MRPLRSDAETAQPLVSQSPQRGAAAGAILGLAALRRHNGGMQVRSVPPLFAALLLTALARSQAPPVGFVAGYLTEARGQLQAGDVAAARTAVDRALERDARSLPALQLLAEIAAQQHDTDTAVHTLHRWLEVFDARADKKASAAAPAVAERKTTFERLLPLDTKAPDWGKLQAQYVTGCRAIHSIPPPASNASWRWPR